jgi:hypothetical protein
MKEKKELCSICSLIHIRYDDGLGYLDCILAMKLKEKRDYKIEIWNMDTKTWIPQKEYYS